jgi:predicted DNA-binding ribbon-helix-helix protein
MVTTVRQSVTLTKNQHEILKAEADRLGVTVSDLIRRIVDGWRDERREK